MSWLRGALEEARGGLARAEAGMRQARDIRYLDVTAELGNLPLAHGAHNGLPHGQLELLANDELHGFAAHAAVIQHSPLLVAAQSSVVERGLRATGRIRPGHKPPPSPQDKPSSQPQDGTRAGLTQGSPLGLYPTTQVRKLRHRERNLGLKSHG